MVIHFDADILTDLAQRQEVRIDVPGADGKYHHLSLWFVIHAGNLYIRSRGGSSAWWYQELLAHPFATVHVDRHALPVRVLPIADECVIRRISTHYEQKYGYLFPQEVQEIVRDEELGTTFRLEPVETTS